MARLEIAREFQTATAVPPDAAPWLATGVTQAFGLAIIGGVCLAAELAVRAEELATQAAALIAQAAEDA